MEYVSEITSLIQKLSQYGDSYADKRNEASKVFRKVYIETKSYITATAAGRRNYTTERELATAWMEAARVIKNDAIARERCLSNRVYLKMRRLFDKSQSRLEATVEQLIDLSRQCEHFAVMIAERKIDVVSHPALDRIFAASTSRESVDYAQS